jgi:hypothetical protein
MERRVTRAVGGYGRGQGGGGRLYSGGAAGFGDYEQMLTNMRAANLKGSPGASSNPQNIMNNLLPELQSVYDNMTDEQRRLLQQQMGVR